MKDKSLFPVITSRNNARIAEACKLADKKARDAAGLFAFEGIKLLSEAAAAGIEPACVFVTEKAFDRYYEELDACRFDDKIVLVSDSVYDKLSFENAPQGVFCVAPIPKRGDESEEKNEAQNGFAVLLDHVGDPGNLGAIMRSADAFGACKLCISAGSADLYNPKTVRSCMGSLFRVPTETECDLVSLIASLRAKGKAVYAAMLDETARRPFEIEKLEDAAIVIGNEGTGVTGEVRAACTGAVYIPMSESGPQSLNASVAASLLMWEAYKKQNGWEGKTL